MGLAKVGEEVEVGKILHPTQSHAETTPSSPCALPPISPHPDGNSSLPAKCLSCRPAPSHAGIGRPPTPMF